MRLAQLEKDFYALVTGFGGGPIASAEKIVKGGRGMGALRRVRIYGDQYFWRMYEALTLDYPKVAALLPEKTLQRVVKQYAIDCPSRHWDLGKFGSRFVGWLHKNPIRGGRADLVDLATLEWARSEAFLAADATPIDAGAMARVGPEKLPGAALRFVPSCQLLWSEHELAALFDALKEEKTPPRPIARPQQLVVWRKGFVAWHAGVLTDEAKALKAAMAGKPLAAVVAHFAKRDDPAKAAFNAVGSWVNEGMVAAVSA